MIDFFFQQLLSLFPHFYFSHRHSLTHLLIELFFSSIILHTLGAPIKGESVPIRLHLSKLNLTPTYRTVNNVFSIKYYINLVLIDEEDRRYFKQQEVTFWRSEMNEKELTTHEKTKKMCFLPKSYDIKKEAKNDEKKIVVKNETLLVNEESTTTKLP